MTGAPRLPAAGPAGAVAVVVRALRRLGRRQGGLIAAGVAFFALLGLFPGLAAVIALFGLLADPAVIAAQLPLLAEFVPPEAFRLIEAQVNALVRTGSGTLGWAGVVSVAVALWSARAGVGALQGGLDAIHGTPPRGGLQAIVSALVLTVALVGCVIAAFLAVVVAPLVLALVPLGPAAGWALAVLPWVAALGLLLAVLALVYRFGPNRGRGSVLAGVVVALVLWGAASLGFSAYLRRFGAYNEIYGSIGAVAALMMWFYIGAWVVLLGAAVNAERDAPPARPSGGIA
ncbi:MAG: YihY/virulence factor BrkB family protein [Rhodobacteraceae bacterium]|nr:YihY/virulence factor BrkB family protein [Paracoccaceae bacterium]